MAAAADLSWLAGCWASEAGGPGSGEQWMAPAGGSLLGLNRTVREGRTVSYEFMRIYESGDSLTYVAQPSGQSVTSFELVRLEQHEVVFENLAHDFPQRVAYRLDGNVLRARVEGRRGDEVVVVHLPMRMAACRPDD